MRNFKEEWDYWGKNNPYYAVSTFDKFRLENLNEENKQDFFQTGAQHIEKIWNEIENGFNENFQPRTVLDFGCGVGRLVIPLAEKCEQVTGVDISQTMLDEAARNCQKRQITNAEFVQTDAFLGNESQKFDLVHSFIVFQHINPDQGEIIIRKMLSSLNDHGIGMLHFVYANAPDDKNFWRFKIYRDYPLINRLKNLIKRNNAEPLIPMYIYDMNKIFSLLQEYDCHKCLVRFSFHGLNGIVIFFQKNRKIDY